MMWRRGKQSVNKCKIKIKVKNCGKSNENSRRLSICTNALDIKKYKPGCIMGVIKTKNCCPVPCPITPTYETITQNLLYEKCVFFLSKC